MSKLVAPAIGLAISAALVAAYALIPSSHNSQPASASDATAPPALSQMTDVPVTPPADAPADDGITVEQNSNGPSDPYAADAAKAALQNFRQNLATAKSNVRLAYFAAECHVFSSDADVLPFFTSELERLNAEGIADNIVDPKLVEQMKAAGQDGVTISQTSGACDYWHQNPDAVYLIRHEVQMAELH